MLLSNFSRRRYTHSSTPIEKMTNLTKLLDGPNIYMKRDDLLGLTAGGNKTRKLEFLVADALKKGADTLITCGSLQSNHCRLTLAAAVKEGLNCQLILERNVPKDYDPNANGNNFLYKLLGAEKIQVVEDGTDVQSEMEKTVTELENNGRKGYIIPLGGSNEIGTLGYVACAQEIIEQTFESGIHMDHIFVANGSGSTLGGLVTGFLNNNANVSLHGISVSKPNDYMIPLVENLVKKTTTYANIPNIDFSEQLHFYDEYVGEGYGIPTEGMIEAVQMLARTEGILLDPVYTGKVMAGLIDLIRNNKFKKDENVLFIHSGGSPVLYANTELFDECLYP